MTSVAATVSLYTNEIILQMAVCSFEVIWNRLFEWNGVSKPISATVWVAHVWLRESVLQF